MSDAIPRSPTARPQGPAALSAATLPDYKARMMRQRFRSSPSLRRWPFRLHQLRRQPPPTLMTLTATEARPAERAAPRRRARLSPSSSPSRRGVADDTVPVRTRERRRHLNTRMVEIPNALFGRILWRPSPPAPAGRARSQQFTFDPGVRLTGTLHTLAFRRIACSGSGL